MILPVPLSPTFFRLLDLEDGLRASSKPVYGLIFLFRWREDDPDKQEASCPEGLWLQPGLSPYMSHTHFP